MSSWCGEQRQKDLFIYATIKAPFPPFMKKTASRTHMTWEIRESGHPARSITPFRGGKITAKEIDDADLIGLGIGAHFLQMITSCFS
mmetsp:Transcript_29787/g.62652  ORF Transcript_29787/g.62652 Transcript_29787/m.62652 type:complete len:87 (-) Transcript_29787:109-369(-)